MLAQPTPVQTAGSKDVGEVIQRLVLGNIERDRIIGGWILWWSAARVSAEKAGAKP